MADSGDDATAGSKRKATEELTEEAPAPRRIKALDQVVVNKIAAGEIIVAPVHALKELIENCVDAGATQIQVQCKDGGLKLLQITDNGCGINKEDMDILCERFTTSKLTKFEDLTSIGTYGFRGEALASISHIAHLTVTTKTAKSDCAWRAQYSDGKLIPAKPGQSAEPKPVAGKEGTIITVEDLFYNVPSRRRAFRNPSDEYAKILDVVGRYAVHCSGVAFSCKKHGETQMGVSTQSSGQLKDRIRQIYGTLVANELINFDVAEKNLGFKAQGCFTNANYSVKKTTLLLFINHRSVESSAIKKAVEAMYSSFLPKGGHPFVYISLDIEPHRVDVNVHPTKREVNFLYEDEIIDRVCQAIQGKLAAVDTSRAFLSQTLLPMSKQYTADQDGAIERFNTQVGGDKGKASKSSGSGSNNKNDTYTKRYDAGMVRTDARAQKITSMLLPARPGLPTEESSGPNIEAGADVAPTDGVIVSGYEKTDRERISIRLSSIKALRAKVRDSVHGGLTEVFTNHTFIGVVDDRKRIAAIQNSLKLYLVDYGAVSYEYFYQLGLTDFGNFGKIQFDNPLKLTDLLRIAAEEEKAAEALASEDTEMDGTQEQTQTQSTPKDDATWETIITTVAGHLVSNKDMLDEYFSLEINDDGELLSIPLMLKGYTPCLGKLPSFLLNLGPKVNWTSETECFDTFLRELALFYVPEQLPNSEDGEFEEQDASENGEEEASSSSQLEARRKEMAKKLETVLFPAFRKRLLAPKSLLKSVTEVANLKGLYRIFERSC